jgi:hypothetical protein
MHAACTLQEKSNGLAFNSLGCMHYRLSPHVTLNQIVGTAKYVYWNITSTITQSHERFVFCHLRGRSPFALYVFFDVRLPPTFHAPQHTPSVHLPRFRFIPFTPRMVTIRGKNATARSRSKPPGCDFE